MRKNEAPGIDGEVGRRSITENLMLLLQCDEDYIDPPFEPVGLVGRHTQAYELGDGICARLHYSRGITTAQNDYDNHVALAQDGFPVPTVRSELIRRGSRAVFAVDLVDGQSRYGEGNKSEIISDYMQVVSFLELALSKEWAPYDWVVTGNVLRERNSGKIMIVDVTDWKRISTLDSEEARGMIDWNQRELSWHMKVIDNLKKGK